MSIEELVRKVVEEALREQEESLDQTLQEALSRVRQRRSEISERIKNELAVIAKEVRISNVRLIGQAEQEAKKAYLLAIEEMVEDVIKDSLERVKKLKNDKAYSEAITAMIRGSIESIGGEKFRIKCSEEDKRLVNEIARKISEEMGVKILVEPDSITTVGGVKISNEAGTAMLDNTFEARLERLREEIRKTVIKQLFT